MYVCDCVVHLYACYVYARAGFHYLDIYNITYNEQKYMVISSLEENIVVYFYFLPIIF